MEKWAIAPFNGVFLACVGIFAALLVVSSLLLRKKSEKTRKIVLASAMIATCAYFVVYKVLLSMDRPYSEILVANNITPFSWWTELPFQLCNINMILIPIGVLTDNNSLKGFSFFMGPLGATMALIMPCVGFTDYSIFLSRNLGFYITHFMVLVGGIALASYKLYRPTYKSVISVSLTMFLITVAVFSLNMVLRWTGAAPGANYFYSVETQGNPILELFHSWLPYPFLYLLPCLPLIILPYILIVTTGFVLAGKISAKKKAAKNA